MIAIKRIYDVRDGEYDEVWAIIRSDKKLRLNKRYDFMKCVKELSPEWGLFTNYRKWVEEKIWNKDTFVNNYVPQFIHDLKNNSQAHTLLTQLCELDKSGKSICLVCFCEDETLCHRSIIAGILQGLGCNVTGVTQDYSAYYEIYAG